MMQPNNVPTNNLTTCSLSNGRYSVFVTNTGAGYSMWNGYALTRWSADRTEQAEGFFIYLRDLDRDSIWSLGYQPARVPTDTYRATYEGGRVRIARLDDGIEAAVDICVAREDDLEIRRVGLRNLSDRPRRIELTSYAEV